jgi:putative Holliday junction resolvase
MRILAVDPGESHLGLAVSDEGELIARPLATLRHTARAADAAGIVAAAREQRAGTIVVGYALDGDGRPGPQARRAEKLAEVLRGQTAVPIVLYDESFSSQEAAEALRVTGKPRRRQREQIHAAAAAALLQNYLDGHSRETPPG